MDFKENTFMYALALGVVAFVTLQSVFFIVKSWKHAKELGIENTDNITYSLLGVDNYGCVPIKLFIK